jgi:DNA-binding transcriptional LysR family regulator
VASAAVLHGSAIAVVDPITAQEHLARGGVVRPLAVPVQFDFKVVKPAGFGNVPTQRALLKAFATEVTATVAWSAGLAAEADVHAV